MRGQRGRSERPSVVDSSQSGPDQRSLRVVTSTRKLCVPTPRGVARVGPSGSHRRVPPRPFYCCARYRGSSDPILPRCWTASPCQNHLPRTFRSAHASHSQHTLLLGSAEIARAPSPRELSPAVARLWHPYHTTSVSFVGKRKCRRAPANRQTCESFDAALGERSGLSRDTAQCRCEPARRSCHSDHNRMRYIHPFDSPLLFSRD
jgi:hypothetical protein